MGDELNLANRHVAVWIALGKYQDPSAVETGLADLAEAGLAQLEVQLSQIARQTLSFPGASRVLYLGTIGESLCVADAA